MSAFDPDHIERVERVIARDMVKAGLSEVVAPTPAREAARRIMAGEPAPKVIRDLVYHYRGTDSTTKAEPARKPQAEPTGPEPLHVRYAREAGKVAPAARTAADRVSAALAGGNPWQTGNITHQQLVGHLDPTAAARLKREAAR